jgi:alpha-tubulin suppressor-like RCC1 family protein
VNHLAYCWGANGYGSVGNGASLPGADVLQPERVAGGLQFTALTMSGLGVSHSCALTSSGAAYCWGFNGGALGDGSETEKSTPVAVAGGLTFASISAGDAITCAVTPAGVAYCWGNNDYGQLGNGSFVSSPTAVKVAGQP